MPASKITIKEVAQLAGVSIATVSRYLNNPTSLKSRNRTQVESAVKQLKYQPFIYARRLAGGRLNSFGLILPAYEDVFYSFYALETIRGVAAALGKEEIDLHLNLFWGKDNFKSSLVDGVIFADVIGNEAQLDRLVKESIPVVVINHRVEDSQISCVSVDNFKGAYQAVDFLVNHGHSKIAHLAGDLRVQCAQDRLNGYKSVLEKNKIALRSDYIKETNFSRKFARERFEELMMMKEPPTAIFCCSDEVAYEVLMICEEKKIKVPQDLNIIGFDDNPHYAHGSMMLTTVRQPIQKQAALGVEILKEIVSGNKNAIRKVVLEPELVIRDTVKFK